MAAERISSQASASNESRVKRGLKNVANFGLDVALPTWVNVNPELTHSVRTSWLRKTLTRSRNAAEVGEAVAGTVLFTTHNWTASGIIYGGSRLVGFATEKIAKHRVRKGK